MATDISRAGGVSGGVPRAAAPADWRTLQSVVIAAGVIAALLFIVVGVGYRLQLYGDGSIFSYAIAVEDAWRIHWHNISGRMFVFLFCHFPAESYVTLTGNARGGIVLYGLLFFGAPLAGLGATYAADRSARHIIFSCACASTACLAPLVFGFPTETWMAHALFWPALAICHYARPTLAGATLVFAVMLALAFTHEGSLIFEAAIITTLALRGFGDRLFWRALASFAIILAIWVTVKLTILPDAYIAGILMRAARHVFDIDYLINDVSLTLMAVMLGYAVLVLAFAWWDRKRAHFYAALVVAAGLTIYWLRYDEWLLTSGRYYFRTALLIGTPALGIIAALFVLDGEGRLKVAAPLLRPLMRALTRPAIARAVGGAVALVLLVHIVETWKFVIEWSDYTAAIRTLAMSTSSDPALGDPRFVSAARIGDELNEVSWNSTTPFLSILVAPNLAPARLVIDPTGSYFWLPCAMATTIAATPRAIPAASRELIRVHSCEHRS